MTTTDTYALEVGNTPDGDGDYEARVYLTGSGAHLKTFYRNSREQARTDALAWIERHKAHDPTSYTTETL